MDCHDSNGMLLIKGKNLPGDLDLVVCCISPLRDGGVVEDTGDDGQVVCPGARKGGAVCDRGPILVPQAIIIMILKCRSNGNTKAY